MILHKHPSGWHIVVPKTDNNSEFSFDMPIATTGPAHIRERQAKLARLMALRAFSMENMFKALPADGMAYYRAHHESAFETWGKRNAMNFNDYYHGDMYDMEQEAWELYREWCSWHFNEHGWVAL